MYETYEEAIRTAFAVDLKLRDILAARGYYTVDDPYERDETPDSRPTFGPDDGETDGIVLTNALDVDEFLTDEFGGTNFLLIHAVLQGPGSSRHHGSSSSTLGTDI